MARWREVAGEGGRRFADSMTTVARIDSFLLEVRFIFVQDSQCA
jgi:hypothetical protein